MKNIIVIGAGASGMMAAITAARNGCKVRILEHTSKIGRKIEITGNGKCNYTNKNQTLELYRTDDAQTGSKSVQSVLEQFSYLNTLTFFSELGIYAKNRNGYFYPASGQAESVRDVLRQEAEHLGVTFSCTILVQSIKQQNNRYLVQTEGYCYETDAVIIATGSMAAPATGSDGSGYELVKTLGHSVLTPLPALVQLLCKDKRIQNIAGVRADAAIELIVDRESVLVDRGEVQFGQNIISGIPAFQVSRYAVRALQDNKDVVVRLDFLPDFEKEQLELFLKNRLKKSSYKTCLSFFTGLFPKKLSKVLLENAKIDGNKLISDLQDEEWNRLVVSIKSFTVAITGNGTFEQAQACSGGVPLSEISIPSMESIYQKGVYFAGEILDVDGACGGYNLQWAWSSGYCAGLFASKGK